MSCCQKTRFETSLRTCCDERNCNFKQKCSSREKVHFVLAPDPTDPTAATFLVILRSRTYKVDSATIFMSLVGGYFGDKIRLAIRLSLFIFHLFCKSNNFLYWHPKSNLIVSKRPLLFHAAKLFCHQTSFL